jgi:hypothetical protein
MSWKLKVNNNLGKAENKFLFGKMRKYRNVLKESIGLRNK